MGQYYPGPFSNIVYILLDRWLTTEVGQFLIFGSFFSGIGSGCWYVAEAGSILSLAPSGVRGKYLALWIVSRNLGQLVGGGIKYVCTLLCVFPPSQRHDQSSITDLGSRQICNC